MHLNSSILSASILLTAAAGSARAQWTMFHGNAQRDGLSPYLGPVAPTLSWARDLGGAIISSPVLASDGTIYLGSVLSDSLHPSHSIAATNPDGAPRWSHRTAFLDTQTLSSPAIGQGGVLYVGSQDKAFYAIHPDGTLAWKYSAAGPVRQHPVVSPDGTVYVGIDGDLHAFSPTGALLWRAGSGEIGGSGGPSLATDGTIYATGGTAGVASKLFAFDPDGSARWVYTFGNPYFLSLAPPAVGPDGTIFVYTHALYAIRPDGALKWVNNDLGFADQSYGPPAIDAAGNIVYAGWWHVWKLNPQGSILWSYEMMDPACGNFLEKTHSAPLVDAAGRIYVGLGQAKRSAIACEKKLLVLSPAGTLLSSFTFPEAPATSSPALAPDGTLYIGCLDGKLYALR